MPPSGPQSTEVDAARGWLPALILCLGAVGVSMQFVDRPVADFLHGRFFDTAVFLWAARFLAPFKVVFVLLALFLLWGVALAVLGKPPGERVRAPLLGAGSMIVAVGIALILKHFLGRSDPHPTYFTDGSYGFHLFHGGRGFESFPSATTAAVSGFLGTLWLLTPRLRFAATLALAAIIAAILVTNGHWVSDILGGGCLGVSVAWTAVRWIR